MILVLDVGNTNVTLGVYHENRLLNHWRLATQRNKTSDEYGISITGMLAHEGLDTNSMESVVIASVVPPLMHTLESMSIKYFGIKPIVVGPGVKTGVNIKYDNPKEVGADRIVNAVAAIDKYQGPLIIVDFGTATTFCAVSEKGDYLGGSIAPGIKISSEALFLQTAKLPKVSIEKPKQVICKNTVDSMKSGLVYGYVGLVDYLISKMKQEMEGKVETVIATGGLSGLIASESSEITVIDKLLTLDGLNIIYHLNA